MQGSTLRASAAEAVGAFFLVLAGCGAILAGNTAVAVALAFGLALLVLVYALGHVSGAHFNPAITVALAVTGHFPWRMVPAYLGAQVGGGLLAGGVLLLAFGDVEAAATLVAPRVDLAEAFLVETLATAMLALAVVSVATDRRASPAVGGLAIGFAVAAGALWAGPLTGGSFNPARTLATAIPAMEWTDLWLYLTAPFAGATLAMLAYEALRKGAPPAPAEPPARRA